MPQKAMFNWIRSILGRTARAGDLVRILSGPYAGKTGAVLRLSSDQFGVTGYVVYIDDCCQPTLSSAEFRRVGRGRGIAAAARKARESDTEGELARLGMEFRDRDNSIT
jgi:hypothetical protein